MKKRYNNTVLCCLLVTILFPLAVRSQEAMPAMNAVYITKALYENIPLYENGKEDTGNLFTKYSGYYLKGGSARKIDRYPFLKNLYVAYSFALSDSEAYKIIDPVAIDAVQEQKFAGVKTAYKNLRDEMSKLVVAKRLLDIARDTLSAAGIIEADIDENDKQAIERSLSDDSVNVTRDNSTTAFSGRDRDSLKSADRIITKYLSTKDTEEQLERSVAAMYSTLNRSLKALATSAGVDIQKILVSGANNPRYHNLLDLKYRPENQFVTKGNDLTLTTQYLLSQSAGATGFSMPNQTEMIDAMAIFLAKRVEQESILWFFDELKKRAALTEELNVVFPACMALLKNNEEYDMPKMGKAWRYAIAQDFSTMPEHFFDLPLLDSFLKKGHFDIQQLREYVGYGSKIATLIQKKYSIDELINNLYLNLNGDLSDDIISPAHFITLLYAVKQEFYVVDKGNKYLLSPATLINMPDSMFMTMLSITDLKYNQVFSKLLTGKNDDFSFSAGDINKIRKVIARILQEIQQIDNIVKQAKSSSDKENVDFTSLNYTTWQFTSDLIGTFDDLLALTTTCKSLKSNQLYHIQTDLGTLRAVLDVYAHIDKKDYYGAARKMFNIAYALFERYPSGGGRAREYECLRQLTDRYNAMPKKEWSKRRALLDSIQRQILVTQKLGFENIDAGPAGQTSYPLLAMTTATGKDDAEKNDSAMRQIRRAINFDKSRYFVLKVASFLNDVASATNSNDLSKVVAAYALPPTSYKRKTGTWNSVFLNGFVGPYVGIETLPLGQKKGINTRYQSGYVYGLTAPIGLSFSKTFANSKATSIPDEADCKLIKNGRNKGKFRNMSKTTLSVFLSIVDIGAVVSYRFTNSDSTLPHQFKWEQFISPGLHFQYSIHGAPFVISAGGVYTPLIRKLADNNGQYNAIRGYIGILFDIPMLTVYSKEKYKGVSSLTTP